METRTRRIIQRLEREGWYLTRHGRNHDIYRHDNKPGRIEVPRHRTVTIGVARSIANKAGWEN